MCDVCCNEFKGWCKAFTKTERALTILEAVFIVVFIAFLVFLILHLIVCGKSDDYIPINPTSTLPPTTGSKFTNTSSSTTPSIIPSTTDVHQTSTSHSTLSPDINCTWNALITTQAVTHYYEQSKGNKSYQNESIDTVVPKIMTTPINIFHDLTNHSEESDGEETGPQYKSFILALVKLRRSHDITYGCILTIVSEFWTITAASCIESIEEVDSLDSFVMMEGYGEPRVGRTHALADVTVHPQYKGANKSFDLVAIKSADSLRTDSQGSVALASMIDHFLITIGQKFLLLGHGRFRSVEHSPGGRRLRQTHVFSLPRGQCAQPDDTWAPRHLTRARTAPHAACAVTSMCAGVLYARGTPCNYCAGSPLIVGARLFGVMSDNEQCGATCEPASYVNLAAVADWLHAVSGADAA